MTCILLIIENLPQQVPTQLSSKPKIFYQNFIRVSKSIYNFEQKENFQYFEKKDDLGNFNISPVIDFETCGYLIVPKLLFQNTLWKETC